MPVPWWLPFGSVPEIDAQTLAHRLAGSDPPQLLDVRSVTEFEGGHIAGSVLVPITALKGRVEGLELRRDRSVVAICAHARRSIPAVRLLQQAGYQDVVQLQGGMVAWVAAELPVVESR